MSQNWTAKKNRKRAYRRQGGRCFWCNYRTFRKHEPEWMAFPNQRATADHLIPQSLGGKHELSNIVMACESCNTTRGNMPIITWVLFLKRNVAILGGEAQFVVMLQKLATFGIEVVIGQPAQAAPMPVTPDCPPPTDEAPAP